jgi:hypothetical protein
MSRNQKVVITPAQSTCRTRIAPFKTIRSVPISIQAVFAGALILILYFLEEITFWGGMITFGLAAVVYGLLAAPAIVGTLGSQCRQALIEFLVFTAAGAVVIYTLFRGPEALNTSVTVAG